MSAEALYYLSLVDLSAKFKAGALTPLAVTEAVLGRIQQHDGTLKSYTTVLADRAIAQARAASDEISRGF
jgi:amidase